MPATINPMLARRNALAGSPNRMMPSAAVPTAPIPVGGGLLYVPVEWVKPAQIGMDTFTSIYVSMGITPPPPLAAAKVLAEPSGEKPPEAP